MSSVKSICHPELLPEGSPWTCPYERLECTLGMHIVNVVVFSSTKAGGITICH